MSLFRFGQVISCCFHTTQSAPNLSRPPCRRSTVVSPFLAIAFGIYDSCSVHQQRLFASSANNRGSDPAEDKNPHQKNKKTNTDCVLKFQQLSRQLCVEAGSVSFGNALSLSPPASLYFSTFRKKTGTEIKPQPHHAELEKQTDWRETLSPAYGRLCRRPSAIASLVTRIGYMLEPVCHDFPGKMSLGSCFVLSRYRAESKHLLACVPEGGFFCRPSDQKKNLHQPLQNLRNVRRPHR